MALEGSTGPWAELFVLNPESRIDVKFWSAEMMVELFERLVGGGKSAPERGQPDADAKGRRARKMEIEGRILGLSQRGLGI